MCQTQAALFNLAALRDKAVAEARSFIGTPYHKGGRVKGAGVDCGTFLYMVYDACGLIDPEMQKIFNDEKIVPRSQDWFNHTREEKYLRLLMRAASKVAVGISYPSLVAAPGNIVATKSVHSYVFNHAGIVVRWPKIIHAVGPCVELADASSHYLWAYQEVLIFDPFLKALETQT